GALPQRAAEADRKAQYAHAAAACDPEMAELVDGHQDAEADKQPPDGAEEISHGGSSDGTRGNGVAGVVARAEIGVGERLQRLCRFRGDCREGVLDQGGDEQETDAPLKKG